MSEPLAQPPEGSDALLQRFRRELGEEQCISDISESRDDAARRIVAALGGDVAAISLAAECASQLGLDVSQLADALEHPDEDTLRWTSTPPRGSPLVIAVAARHGQLQQQRGDLSAAERTFRWASGQFHEVGDPRAESTALTLLGRSLQIQERLDEAAECYRRSLALDLAVGDRFDVGVDLGLLGQVAWLAAQYDEAERLCRQALALHRRCHDSRNAASTFDTLGHVAEERGRRWQARYFYLCAALARRGFYG